MSASRQVRIDHSLAWLTDPERLPLPGAVALQYAEEIARAMVDRAPLDIEAREDSDAWDALCGSAMIWAATLIPELRLREGQVARAASSLGSRIIREYEESLDEDATGFSPTRAIEETRPFAERDETTLEERPAIALLRARALCEAHAAAEATMPLRRIDALRRAIEDDRILMGATPEPERLARRLASDWLAGGWRSA